MIDVIVSKPQPNTTRQGVPALTFQVALVLAETGEVGAEVEGCRVLKGWLFGPARVSKAGGFTPVVTWAGGLRDLIVHALHKAGWPRAYPAVQFPELPKA